MLGDLSEQDAEVEKEGQLPSCGQGRLLRAESSKAGRSSASSKKRRVPSPEPRKHVQGTQEKPVWVEMVSFSLPCLKSFLEA